MITYKDKTFCASFGICANTECPHWLDIEKAGKQDLPVSMAELKSDTCGYKPNPFWEALQKAVEIKGETE